MQLRFLQKRLLVTLAMCLLGIILVGSWHSSSSLIEIYHMPEKFSRRSGDFTANITGKLSPLASSARFQLNAGPWRELKHAGPRAPSPFFIIELFDLELLPGINHLTVEAKSLTQVREKRALKFEYDPEPIELPLTVDWSKTDLDVQDGFWETFELDGQTRVRPKPGYEDYDRILMVTGAFAEGRRIETDFVFRHDTEDGPYGFGILPLWGGHPDKVGYAPRRGWKFSLVWFYSMRNGIGMEFSLREGSTPPKWVSTYHNLEPKPDTKYFLIVEAWPELNADGVHQRYKQRMKWRQEGDETYSEWMELTDTEGSPLPAGEFSIALVAHRSQVDFGPVVVKPLKDFPAAEHDNKLVSWR